MIEINTPESMYFVQEGLRNPKTAFMQSMFKVKSYNLGDPITPMGIAFYVSPLLNASVRVGTLEEKQIRGVIASSPCSFTQDSGTLGTKSFCLSCKPKET